VSIEALTTASGEVSCESLVEGEVLRCVACLDEDSGIWEINLSTNWEILRKPPPTRTCRFSFSHLMKSFRLPSRYTPSFSRMKHSLYLLAAGN